MTQTVTNGRPIVGIDAGALMLHKRAPGTAKFVREQTRELLSTPVPWDWVVAVPQGYKHEFAPGAGREIIELEGRKYSLFATVRVARLWKQRRCLVGISPAGICALYKPVLCNYFDSTIFEYGKTWITSGEWARSYLLKWMAIDTFRRAERVFVNSSYCTEVLRNRFPDYRDKFRVNPVGISTAEPSSSEQPSWANQSMEQRGFILCSSAFSDNKNQRRLIEAYVMLQNTGREMLPLVLIGPCPPDYFATVIKLALAASPRPGNIIVPGYVSAGVLAWAFKHAKMVVQPSFAEGFSSFSVFQAMQGGVPVACSNTTSHPEAVGSAALLFHPESVPSISEAMARLLDEDALRRRLIEAGMRRIRELTWSANAEQVCGEILNIMEERCGRV
jgi:glycosyltransferase involved in cell wall biosynthesis